MSDLAWADDADAEWADTFTLHAAWSTIATHADITSWLAEVHEAVTDTGRRAENLFGPPRAAADERVASLPAERRAAVDPDGSGLADVPQTSLLVVSWFLTVFGVMAVVGDGWTTSVTPARLFVLLALVTGGVAFSAALTAWRSGRRRLAGGTVVVALAVVGPLIAVSQGLDTRREPLWTMPSVVVLGLGLIPLAFWWWLPTPTASVDDSSRDWPAERWFARLEAVLRGRYSMPRAHARGLVDEARSHAADAAVHPWSAFGPPEVHALALADADVDRERFRARSESRWVLTLSGAAALYAVADLADDGPTWRTLIAATACVSGLVAVRALRRPDSTE